MRIRCSSSSSPCCMFYDHNCHPNPFFSSVLRPSLLLTAARVPGNKVGIHLNVRHSLTSSSAAAGWDDDDDNVLLLSAKEDDHGGVIVEMPTTNPPIHPILFTSLLKTSMLHWKQQGKKGVWIKLPVQLVNLIEPALKEGFYYHHAEPTYLMLAHWIPPTLNTLPPNATHRVGVGAFVIKDNQQVLVVQEKGGKMRGTGIWKFPTGVVEEGEDICDAAVREVKEETGIDAKFVEILAFRESHKKFFNKSDLFFMCMLQPVSFDIQKQDREIAAAQWMAFEEYAAQPFVQKNDLPKYVAEICLAKMRNNYYTGFSPVSTISSFSKTQNNLYLSSSPLLD